MAELNSGIILAGQTPDFMGGIYRANEQAALQGERDRQNALARFYQEQGSAVAQGDAGALNALARFSPEAALGVRGARQGMKHADERLGMDRERLEISKQTLELAKQQAAQTAQLQAQKLSAAERQAELERTQAALQGASMAQTPDQWNSFLSSNGIDPSQYPFEQREMFLAQAIGVKETLEALGGGKDSSTANMKEYRFAQENGFTGSFTDYLAAKKDGTVVNVHGDQPAPNIGTIPQGYSVVPDPDEESGFRMVAIPGGPKDTSANDAAKAQQAQRAGTVVLEDINRIQEKIESAPWYSPTTGAVGNMIANIGGTRAFDVGALLRTVGGNIGFDRLQQMRDASPTGGALGAINQQELNLLMSVMGSLEQSQSEDQLLQNLDRLEKLYTSIMRKAAAYPNAAEFGFDGLASGDGVEISDDDLIGKYLDG